MCVRIGVRSGIGCLNNIPGMLLLHWIGLDREESSGWLRLGGGREENGNSKKAGVRHHKTEQSPSAGSECSGSEASEGVEREEGVNQFSWLLVVANRKQKWVPGDLSFPCRSVPCECKLPLVPLWAPWQVR